MALPWTLKAADEKQTNDSFWTVQLALGVLWKKSNKKTTKKKNRSQQNCVCRHKILLEMMNYCVLQRVNWCQNEVAILCLMFTCYIELVDNNWLLTQKNLKSSFGRKN